MNGEVESIGQQFLRHAPEGILRRPRGGFRHDVEAVANQPGAPLI